MNNDFIIKDRTLKKYTGTAEEVTISSEDVDAIGKIAFNGCRSLKKLILEGVFKCIDKSAFSNCINLESVTIKGSAETIGDGAFAFCHNLRDFDLTGTVEVIGKNAFCFCKNFDPENSYLLDNVREVGDKAFKLCGTINIDLNERANGIKWGKNVYEGNRRLKSAVVYGRVPDGMFRNCRKLKNVEFIGTYYIGEEAFKDCTALKAIDLRSSPECAIQYEAFAGCTGLKKVHLSDKGEYYIMHKAFYGCTGLEEISLPEGTKSIMPGVFACCINLRSIKLPESIISVPRRAFRDCISLESVHIGSNVEFIDEEAFFGCRSLTKINIPESVKEIGDYVFAECDKLSLSVDPKILAPGSDIFGSTYGADDADEITGTDVETAMIRAEIEEKLDRCFYRIVFFDCEMSGLFPDNSEIIQVVAETYDLFKDPVNEMYDLDGRKELNICIKPTVPLFPEVERITGITNEMLSDMPTEKDAFESVRNIFDNANIIVCYNARFQIPFLEAMYKRCGSEFTHCENYFDTFELSVKLLPEYIIGKERRLDKVAAYFGGNKAENGASKVRRAFLGLARKAGINIATT